MAENNSNKLEDIKPLDFSLGAFILLFIGVAWITLLPPVIVGYIYFQFFPFSFSLLNILVLIPLFLVLYGVSLISSYAVTKTGFWIVHKRITAPIPGSYPFTMQNPHTRAYVIKGNIKPFGRWLFRFFNLQILKKIWLRSCGVKLGKKVRIADHLHDEDLIEVGNNVFFSKYCQVSGHLMNQWALTLNKTIIGNDIIMEPFSGGVGCVVGDNSIFRSVTGAMKGQICRGNAIYQGIPCRKIGDNDSSAADIKALKKKIRDFDKKDYIKDKNAPIKISRAKMVAMKTIVIIGSFLFAILFLFLFYLFLSLFYSPTSLLANISLILLLPLGIYVAFAFFVAGSAIFIKIFLIYYDRKVEIPEGTYELDDPRAKIFKIKYMLRMFGIKIVRKSPISIADTFAMRAWGNISLGMNIVIQDAIIDPQYLELGDNVVVGGAARIHTHEFIDGKLYIKKVKIAKNVMLGAFSHIGPGVEIAEGSLVAVLSHVEKDQKCETPKLWMGQPAIQLPIEMVTQTAGFDQKVVDDMYDKAKVLKNEND